VAVHVHLRSPSFGFKRDAERSIVSAESSNRFWHALVPAQFPKCLGGFGDRRCDQRSTIVPSSQRLTLRVIRRIDPFRFSIGLVRVAEKPTQDGRFV